MKTTFAVLTLAILVATGCAQEHEADEPATTGDTAIAADTTMTATTDTGLEAESNRVEVKLVDYEIQMPSSIAAGKTTINVSNDGTHEHNFEIEGNGIEQKFATALKPGEVQSMVVDLTAGTYKIYCPVADHEGRGMTKQLEVTGATEALTDPSPATGS